jgi:hypothetical protein
MEEGPPYGRRTPRDRETVETGNYPVSTSFLGRAPTMKEPSIIADAILEIPASELQRFFDDLILTFNSLNDLLRDQGILRGKELADLNTRASKAVKAARSPIEKLKLVLNPTSRR